MFLLGLNHPFLQGQVSLDRYVLSFVGDTYREGELALDVTGGDLAVSATQNGPLALYQGFQQGYPEGLPSDISTHTEFLLEELKVYPNPTPGDFYISLSLTEWIDLKLLLYNAEGRLILEEYIGKVHELERHIDLDLFAKGLYLLKLTNSQGQFLGKVKIIKW